MQLAVNETNADPTFLPGINIKIKRYDCEGNFFDPYWYYSTTYSSLDFGGASMVMADKAVNENKNLVFAMGDWDVPSKFSGQVFSYYKIPMCGWTNALNPTSDRKKYRKYTISMGKNWLTIY
jgi:hypothetical protein